MPADTVVPPAAKGVAKRKKTLARGFSTVFGKGLHDERVLEKFRPVTIVCIFTIDGPVEPAAMRTLVSERWLKYERFRSLMVMEGNRVAFQELDPEEVDLNYHVKFENSEGWTQKDFDAFLCKIYGSVKDVDRPLWSFHICNNLADGRSMVVLNCDHCCVDGISLSYAFALMMDLDPPGEKKPAKSAPRPRASFRVPRLGMLSKLAVMAGGVVEGLLCPLLTQDPPSSLKVKDVQNPSKDKAFSNAAPISMEKVSAIKTKLGVTVNDVLGGLLNMSLQRYYEANKASILSSGRGISVSYPINMRLPGQSIESTFHNVISTGTIGFGLKHPSTFAAIAEHNWKMQGLKLSPAPSIWNFVLTLSSKLLPIDILISLALKLYGRYTIMMSNVPGPGTRGTLTGKPVRGIHFYLFLPIGLYCGLYSYAGGVVCSISCDAETEANPSLITDVWTQEFEKLYEEVMDPDFKPSWTPPTDLEGMGPGLGYFKLTFSALSPVTRALVVSAAVVGAGLGLSAFFDCPPSELLLKFPALSP